ncbi:mycofactocin system transcriptional regulator [Humibacter soli]
MAAQTISPASGRRATSIAHLSHVGLELFFERGFDATTVDDIAAAAGIGRRTFFRYFASKNDLPWGEFDILVDEMRERLAGVPRDVPMFEALHDAILEFNRYPDDELGYHRERMQLLLNVPSLVAHSTLRYASWRAVIAEFAARRLDLDPLDLRPQEIAWIYLAVSLASYEQWLRDRDRDLVEVLDRALTDLEVLFGGLPGRLSE